MARFLATIDTPFLCQFKSDLGTSFFSFLINRNMGLVFNYKLLLNMNNAFGTILEVNCAL